MKAIFKSVILSRCLVVLAVLIGFGDRAAAQSARPAVPAIRPGTYPAVIKKPMVFYLAKGEADACGPGCSEWIAAEGEIDAGAVRRLQAILARSGKRKLPIFFHSPGGFGVAAMSIGRLLRERKMTAGVSRTIPAECAAATDEACLALKQSGQTLVAELQNVASCSSACVSALIGAAVRQVPAGARLGVHTGKLLRRDPDGRFKALMDTAIRRYHQEMQISSGLYDIISRVPHEQVRYLSRDEIATFGIDKREFQETRWTAVGQTPEQFAVQKYLLQVKGKGRKEYRMSLIWVACASPGRVVITYSRGLASDEIATAPSIEMAFADRKIVLPKSVSISKMDSIDTGGSFDLRFTYEPLKLVEAAAERDSIDIIEADAAGPATSPRITKLATAGLPKALDQLKKTCGGNKSFDAPAVEFFDTPKVLDAPKAWGGR